MLPLIPFAVCKAQISDHMRGGMLDPSLNLVVTAQVVAVGRGNRADPDSQLRTSPRAPTQ